MKLYVTSGGYKLSQKKLTYNGGLSEQTKEALMKVAFEKKPKYKIRKPKRASY